MKRALVLSGGGANGAFHVGALTYLWERGQDFDIVSGVSVGALNGALVAQGKQQRLVDIWKQVRQEQVYHRYPVLGKEWPAIVVRMLLGRLGLYDASPLLKFIESEVRLDEVQKEFRFGVTSLFSGKYYSLSPDKFSTDSEYQKAVYASALMPLIWAPVNVKQKAGEIREACDGGVRNITPLADVIPMLPDVIYIISTHAENGVAQQENMNIFSIIKRVFLGIMLDELMRNDTKWLLFLNELVLQAEGLQKGGIGFVLRHPRNNRPLKYFKAVVIQPKYSLGSPLDFSREHIDRCISYGHIVSKTK